MPNAFAHIELSTDNLKKAEKFYKTVFSWKLRPMPKFKYTMIEVEKGGTGGGMQKKMDSNAPNAWLPYVEVSDVKDTVKKATKAGAKVMLDYMDIGDMGAIGIFADPSGATIGVWQQKGPAPKAEKKSGKSPKKR